MARKQHKYHFTYKTVNLINGKYYVGMHSTSNLEDGYLGSGKRLRYSINKYGKENFKLEILEFFENKEKLIEAEIEMITEEMLSDPLCMNLKEGGSGGFIDNAHQLKCSIAGGLGFKEKLKTDEKFKTTWTKNNSNAKLGTKNPAYGKCYNGFKGKLHSNESKRKIGEKNSKNIKEKNSQYGKCWIYNINFKTSISIKLDELEIYLNNGWIKGRKLKF